MSTITTNINIYHHPLLNLIHAWYPEILYNPSRFRNVRDLLDYIRSGASLAAYERGLNIYNNLRSNDSSRPDVTPTTIRPASGAGTSYRDAISPAIVSVFEYNVDNGTEVTPTTNIRASIPLTLPVRGMPDIGTNILSALLGLSGTGGLESFLGQSVAVRPTTAQIASATTVNTSQRPQNDNCVICQDIIDTGDSMRRINHCQHLFHKDCIDTWFETNVHCPTCRHDIRESVTSSDSESEVPEVTEIAEPERRSN